MTRVEFEDTDVGDGVTADDGVCTGPIVDGNGVEEGTGEAPMLMDNDLLVVAPLLSVIWRVKLDIPAVVGIPEIVPVLAFNIRPLGKIPTEIDQV